MACGVGSKVCEKIVGCNGDESLQIQDWLSISPTTLLNYWNQRIAAVERQLVFDVGPNESLEDDVHSFVDQTTYLTTAVFEAECRDEHPAMTLFTPTTVTY